MKTYIHFILLLLIPSIGFAQQQKTLHQTFEIEEVERLNFNLYDEFEVEKWEGNTLLTETKIQVNDATKGIFNHYVEKEGRYEILLKDTPSAKAEKTAKYELNEDYFNDDEPTTNDEPEEKAPVEEEVIEPVGPEEGVVYLTSKDSKRVPIRTRSGECLEIIKVRIFIPEDFNRSGQNSYFRTLPDEDDDN